MQQILDIHSHREAPATITSLSVTDLLKQFGKPENVILNPDRCYSIGIHPWDTDGPVSDEMFAMMETIAQRPEIVAIGECGIDTLKGGPMFRQINVFKQHILLSEKIRKPLIIHNVKAHDQILALHRDMNPKMSWAVHGFRNKPQIAAMFIDRGIYLSFGPKFNPDTLRATPSRLILAETDDASGININDVITALASELSTLPSPLSTLIAANTAEFLK